MKLSAQTGTFLCLALSMAACGGTTGNSPDAGPDSGAAIDASSLDGPPDAPDAAPAAIDSGGDAGAPQPWDATPTIVGVGHAMSAGVAGPVFPFAVLAAGDRVFVVGEARAELRWGDATIAGGGYLLAIEASTGALLFQRSFGPGSTVNGIARIGADFVIVGSFISPTSLTPTVAAPIELTTTGAADGFVARMTANGEFVWGTSFGSGDYDGAFDVRVSARGILVSGYLRGDWSGCGGTLRTFPGFVDPMEGRILGSQDALLLQYDAAGTCVDASVVGNAGTDEFAIGVAATDDAIYLSGEGGGPLTRRSVAGDEAVIGGSGGGWLVRLADDGSRDVWSVTGRGSRGRGLGIDGDDLYFSFTASGAELRHGDTLVRAVEDGVSVMHLSLLDGSAATWWLGAATSDTIDLAISSAGVVIPATGSDYRPHTRVALLAGGLLTSFRNDAVTPYPFVVSAEGRSVWMAGCSSDTSVTLGAGEVAIPLGPQGGMFLVRFDL